MKIRLAVVALLACSALTLAACGSDDKKNSDEAKKEEAKATPQEAIAEIGEVKTLLAKAVTEVGAGDKAAAEETVSTAYVEHFELVEGPLEEVDPKLNEELEEAIREQLRDAIKSGASEADLQQQVEEIDTALDTAAKKLE